MTFAHQGKSRVCAHEGCTVRIRLADQPRRFALGLCRKHEGEATEPRGRVADRPDVRRALVFCSAPSNAIGALASVAVSVKKEPWETPVENVIPVDNSLSRAGESTKMSGPGGATNATPGPDHRQSDKETAHMADAATIAESRALSTRNISGIDA